MPRRSECRSSLLPGEELRQVRTHSWLWKRPANTVAPRAGTPPPVWWTSDDSPERPARPCLQVAAAGGRVPFQFLVWFDFVNLVSAVFKFRKHKLTGESGNLVWRFWIYLGGGKKKISRWLPGERQHIFLDFDGIGLDVTIASSF